MLPSWLTDSLPGLLALVLGGGLLVWAGAEVLVRSASRFAIDLGMSPFLVGATVLAFGTSAPEWFVSFIAHIQGRSELSLGNVVGSNVCNLGLVLGLTAALLPVRVRSATLRRDLPLVVLAEAAFFLLIWDGRLTLGDGLVLIGGFGLIYAWLTLAIQRTHRAEQGATRSPVRGAGIVRAAVLILLGLLVLVGGAHLFVEGAANLARRFGVREVVIGATVVAVGTSLPELATSLVAALRGQLDISVGNLLGSNLFNALFVGGTLACIGDVQGGPAIRYHCWWMLAVTIAIFPLATYTRLSDPQRHPRIDRLGGCLLMASYLTYAIVSFY